MSSQNKAGILAVDGGGTKSRAILYDHTGGVLGYAEGGSVNYHGIGQANVARNIFKLLRSVSATPRQVACAVFGLAGLDTKQDRQILTVLVSTELMRAGLTVDKVIVENDGVMVLNGAVGSGDGLLLIAGTGSIACGKRHDGRLVRVGGWGSRAGDEGSGFSIALAGVRHVLRVFDGRESSSGISNALLQEFGMADVEQLVDWIYSSEFSTDNVAALAPIIARLADAGDLKAIDIIETAARELGLMASTVINKLELSNSAMHAVLSGGVLDNNPRIKDKVAGVIQRAAPQVAFSPPLYKPILGGVLLGLRSCGLDADSIMPKIADALLRMEG